METFRRGYMRGRTSSSLVGAARAGRRFSWLLATRRGQYRQDGGRATRAMRAAVNGRQSGAAMAVDRLNSVYGYVYSAITE
jgi:hypothetical protein